MKLGIGLGLTALTGLVEASASAPEIVQANNGALFINSPGSFYQDRSTTPSTTASVGDPVGTWTDETGDWFAISPTDGERPTLRQDNSGNLYLDPGGTSRMQIQDSGGSPMPASLTHSVNMVSQRVSGVMHAVCSSTGRGMPSLVTVGSTSLQYRMRNLSGGNAVVQADAYWNVPNIVSYQYSTTGTDFVFRVDGVEYPTTEDMFDLTTALPNEFWLFTGRSNSSLAAAGVGRMYAVALTENGLTSEELDVVDLYLETVAPPVRALPVSTDPVIINFQDGEYEWGGVTRSLTDLTDNADETFTLDYMDWQSKNTLAIVDFLVDDLSIMPADTALVEFSGDDTYGIYLDPTEGTYKIGGGIGGGSEIRLTSSILEETINRVAFYVDPKTPNAVFVNSYDPDQYDSERNDAFLQVADDVTMARNSQTGLQVQRVKLLGNELSAAQIEQEVNVGIGQPVHFLADSYGSFTGENSLQIATGVQSASVGFLAMSDDSVGGSTLTQQAARFSLNTNFHTHTLVVVDGSLEDQTSGDASVAITALNSMLGDLDGHDRMLYLESNPINDDFRYDDWNTAQSAIEAAIGSDKYVSVFEKMQTAHNDTDVAGWNDRLFPASTTTADNVHLTQTGLSRYGEIIFAALIREGYISGATATVPGAPASFAESSLDLSWSLPTDEGNSPTTSFTVSVETSPGSGTFTDVYTGQLRRHTLTGLSAGTYAVRVTATNEVGTGTHAEISVTVS